MKYVDIFSDYRPIPHLDTYEQSVLDDQEQSDLDVETRLEAERQMEKRDREEGFTTGRMRRGLLYGNHFKCFILFFFFFLYKELFVIFFLHKELFVIF